VIHLALDARSVQEQPMGGVGRVTAQVLPHLVDRLDIELLTAVERPPINMGLPEHSLPTPWPGVASEWLQWSASRWLRSFDGIFHCPWYALPFRQSVPMVVTLHDISFEHYPEWFGARYLWPYRVQARWAARTARVVVTVANTVADDLMRTYGVPAERIIVAPNAPDAIFSPNHDATAVLRRLGVEGDYLVAIGGAARRNLDVAIEAWRAVRETYPIDLVVVGANDLPHEQGIVGGRLDDADWAAVLANARALVYPTLYEGFGLPAIEAAASGTPVVCARVGALPEVLEDAAVWCAAPTAVAVTAGLLELLESPAYADDVRAAGLRRAAEHPTWADSADAYYEAYQRAAH
jgi:alpha-1,3-rhamnosyl/mannosyltransferase